jgi:hypothetical protein
MSLIDREREDLVNSISALMGQGFNPSGLTKAEADSQIETALWAALCHTTGRTARFFHMDDQSPQARIYHLLFKAFKDDKS